MRVLHVTRTFYPAIGGMEDSIQNLALQQRKAGVDARVLTLDRPAGSRFDPLAQVDTVSGIPVQRIPWRGSSRFPFAPSVVRHLAGADLVHVHAIDFFFDFLALTRLVHRRPMVASTHGGFFHTPFMRQAKLAWFNTITRLSVSAYNGIIASSESDAELFRPLRPKLLRTIRNGVDVQKWAGRGSPDPVKHLLYFGRLASHKGIDALFKLQAALQARDSGWRLTVAGSPADMSADELRARSSGMGDAVRIVVSPDSEAMAKLIGKAGYFACASSYEGFGIAAVEALSAGLVPVLSDIPPFARLVAGLDQALLFDPNNPASTSDRLIGLHGRLLTDWGATRERLMAVASRYDWADVGRTYADFYAEALQRRDNRGAERSAAI